VCACDGFDDLNDIHKVPQLAVFGFLKVRQLPDAAQVLIGAPIENI
jgi:hypothetical protein